MASQDPAPDWKRKGTHRVSRVKAVGGTLRVAGDRLVFLPSELERRMHAEDWSLALADITGFRVAPVRVADAIVGGLRPRLALDVGRGTTHLFVVPDPRAAAEELLAIAAEAAVDARVRAEGGA
ncbi:hypothetical protein [Patulibacter minatonensis]|uniref:hypothetical protein n=1 Tax=Patulibacter minatonensis TaxID=298163 RepID=UPI0004788B5C|nr:hypothetical protein [Patulibacter minatonensis]